MIIKEKTKSLPLEHEPGESLTIRMLTWVELEEARSLKSETVIKPFIKMGGAELRELMSPDDVPSDDDGEKPDAMPELDKAFTLHKGIVGWSYDAPLNDANIDHLDYETSEVAYKAIRDFSQRSTAQGEG